MPDKRMEPPWERQKGESAQAFAAFSLYLELGPERSITKVVQELNKSRAIIGKWSSAHHWVERARVWDNHLRQEAKRAAEKEVRDMARRHIQIARQIQNAAIQALKELGSGMVNPKNFAAVVRLATDLERQNCEAEASVYSGVPDGDGNRSNLLEAIQEIGEIDTDDLPEVE